MVIQYKDRTYRISGVKGHLVFVEKLDDHGHPIAHCNGSFDKTTLIQYFEKHQDWKSLDALNKAIQS